jgi:predicted metal-dependent HD superfamily phosphohydrolase
MTSPTSELQHEWQHLAGAGHDEAFLRLLAHHAEPHRRYHTAVHVMWVLRHVHRLLRVAPDAGLDGDVIRLAALYHDAVYDPLSSTNEADSARLAEQMARSLGWDHRRCSRVAELIELTAHRPPDATVDADADADAAILMDADLAVLGDEPAVYQAYVNGVRAEYAHVSDHEWRLGRSAVLRSLLARDPLFLTTAMRDERERRARANITAELAGLG